MADLIIAVLPHGRLPEAWEKAAIQDTLNEEILNIVVRSPDEKEWKAALPPVEQIKAVVFTPETVNSGYLELLIAPHSAIQGFILYHAPAGGGHVLFVHANKIEQLLWPPIFWEAVSFFHIHAIFTLMPRTRINDIHAAIGTSILVEGWVDVRRDQGKMVFFDLRDRSGKVQCVVLPSHEEALEIAKLIRPEWVLRVTAAANKRPEKNVNAGDFNGDVELEVLEIKVLSRAEELPFDKDAELNLDTHLDHLPLTLRRERIRDIFKVQATILNAYRQSLLRQEFTEFVSPALVGGDAEGGAAVFSVDYFKNHTAYLATSPQFYKQIMVGAFERSFTIAKVFRAEKSATTRHLSEITQMDFEMGFIENERDAMAVLENVIKDVVSEVIATHRDVFQRMQVPLPKASVAFPVLTLTEAQEILKSEYGIEAIGLDDLEPEHERKICEWALEKHDSDFVFITRFPTKVRAFYTYEDPSEEPYSRGFDLLFRGLEINSGAQRIHEYNMLVERIKERGMKPELFSYYLQAFKYGMPPHGGSSTGLERFTGRMLLLQNVKEATAFPRDMNRIDTLLSQ